MTNTAPTTAHQHRLGAAYHEAGHAVVASALGLTVGRIEIAIDGDDAKGATDIHDDLELPLVDRIAICAAGLEAQKVFEAPTHDLAGLGDYGKINTPGPQPVLGNLVGYEAATIPTSIKSQRNSISMGLLIRMGGRTAESSHPCVNYIMMIIAARTSKNPTPTIIMKRKNLSICP